MNGVEIFKYLEVKFWRSKAGAEVDFIMDKKGLIAIESKSGGRGETRSLKSFREKYNPDKTIVLCRNILEINEGVIKMPFVFVSSLNEVHESRTKNKVTFPSFSPSALSAPKLQERPS